jgi:hypothetical protein
MRDEFAQVNGLAGQAIEHSVLKDFISRNYARDTWGRYFFQNGPQRVFVSLDATPWVARIIPENGKHALMTQCQTHINPSAALSDESGNIYIVGLMETSLYQNPDNQTFTKEYLPSVALLHDHDLDQFSGLAKLHEEACSFGGSWNWQGKQLPLDPVFKKELEVRFDFMTTPTLVRKT